MKDSNNKYATFFQAQRDVSPDGFHPEHGSYYDEGGECGVPFSQRYVAPTDEMLS